MPYDQAQALFKNGTLSVSGEKFVTKDLSYIDQLAARHPNWYETVIQSDMAPGTVDSLISAGRRSSGKLLDERGFIDMPPIDKGMLDAVHVKAEGSSVNYGLRSGSQRIFNERIIRFRRIR